MKEKELEIFLERAWSDGIISKGQQSAILNAARGVTSRETDTLISIITTLIQEFRNSRLGRRALPR